MLFDKTSSVRDLHSSDLQYVIVNTPEFMCKGCEACAEVIENEYQNIIFVTERDFHVWCHL